VKEPCHPRRRLDPGQVPAGDLGRPGRRWVSDAEVAETHYTAFTSDDVTGDFSFGAVGVLDDRSGPLRNAGSFTVAGNVIDTLEDLRPVKSPLRHIARSVGICGSPNITVTGLVVDR
jgi:predicted Zn-dependent protease